MHPQARAFLDGPARATRFPAIEDLQDPGRRQQYLDSVRGSASLPHNPIPVRQVDEDTAFNVPVRVYHGSEPSVVVVYMHGGGWILGDLNMHDAVCRYLARHVPAVVVNVDYRLAPETPYPGALDDVSSALCWASERASRWGVSPERLVIAGSSAGGNLATAAALRARDDHGPSLAGQVLIYPVTDHTMETESYRLFGNGEYYLSADQMTWSWQQYVPEASRRNEPYVSPLRGEDLSGLPPTFVLTAEYDPLRDEGEQYAARLEKAGVSVSTVRFPGQIHGFVGRADVFDDAEQALSLVADAIRTL
jgi:acetyl esterase